MANTSSNMYYFQLFAQILSILIYIGILTWLNKISKCKCIKKPNDIEYLKFSSLCIIIVDIILFLIVIYNGDFDIVENNVYIQILYVYVAIFAIIYLIKLFMFIKELKKINCDCGLLREENLIYSYVIFELALVVFTAFIAIIGLIFYISLKK